MALDRSLQLALGRGPFSIPLDGLVVRLDVQAELGRAGRVLVSVEDERVLGKLAELGQGVVHLLRRTCLSAWDEVM